MSAIQLVALFVIYSFVGWILDSIARSVIDRRWGPGGFSFLPLCPSYGTAAVILIILGPHVIPFGYAAEWVIYGLTLGLLEYISGIVMVKVWHHRIWKYKGWPHVLDGHTDAAHAVFWGALGVVFLHGFHPAIATLLLALTT